MLDLTKRHLVSSVLTDMINDSVSYEAFKAIGDLDPLHFPSNNDSEVKYRREENFDIPWRDPLYIVLPVTVIYIMIFFTGIIGNVSTCVVIAKNKSMHTATNYYLFSLAISDLLLLISGLPPEMYYIWSHFPYIFGEIFCVVQSFAAETSANATVLTITAFTVERYVAICHPFISHTMSKLSRAVKFVIAIWILALCLAIPQAIQFGVVTRHMKNGTEIPDSSTCSVKWILFTHAFQVSSLLFFVVPMTIITVLYVLIGIKLRRSRLLTVVTRYPTCTAFGHCDSAKSKSSAQRNVIRMLVAVVVTFFICWAPFHAQRLLAVYAQSMSENAALVTVYTALTYVSGIFYYLSTTVNPLLYNIMSNKFREAFKAMLSKHCGRGLQKTSPRRPTYSSLSRYPRTTIHRADTRPSGSVSVSDETQKLAPSDQTTISTKLINCSNGGLGNRELCPLQPLDTKIDSNRSPKNDKSLSRGSSDSSQITVMTTLGKSVSEGNNNTVSPLIDESSLKTQKPKTVNLGLLAERLKLSAGGLFVVQPCTMKQRMKPEVASAPPRITSQPSTDSANTISNTSLQDLDETEFTGAELARYMKELNFDLIT